MSDWDFLFEMSELGYSETEIMEAAASGGAPWDWDYIQEKELQERFPEADLEVVKVFEELVYQAASYKRITGRYLQIFGELGELFAEITFGIKRHKPFAQGSDGLLGNDHVEIKTISPDKKDAKISVKRTGNFNKLLAIKISPDWAFEARMIDRKDIKKGSGKIASVSWKSMKVFNGVSNKKTSSSP